MRLYLTLKGTDVENCGNDHEDADSEEYMSLAMEALNPDRHSAHMAQEDTPTEDALDDRYTGTPYYCNNSPYSGHTRPYGRYGW